MLTKLEGETQLGKAVAAPTSSGAKTGTAIVCREGTTLSEPFSIDGGQTTIGARWTRGDQTFIGGLGLTHFAAGD